VISGGSEREDDREEEASKNLMLPQDRPCLGKSMSAGPSNRRLFSGVAIRGLLVVRHRDPRLSSAFRGAQALLKMMLTPGRSPDPVLQAAAPLLSAQR
jgi:hypothetical protein